MARKPILFMWTGYAPRALCSGRVEQVTCAAVFPSRAAFMRATGRKQSDMPYVSVDDEVSERESVRNQGGEIALANPGVVYFRDTIRHTHREDVWVVHEEAERS